MKVITLQVVILSALLTLSLQMIPSVAQGTKISDENGQQTSNSEQISRKPLYQFDNFTDIINPKTFGIFDMLEWNAKFLFSPAAFQQMVPIYIYPFDKSTCEQINASTRNTLARYGFMVVDHVDAQNFSQVWWASPEAFCFKQEWDQFRAAFDNGNLESFRNNLKKNFLLYINALMKQNGFWDNNKELLQTIEEATSIESIESNIRFLSDLIQVFLLKQHAHSQPVEMDNNMKTDIFSPSNNISSYIASVSPIDGVNYTDKLWASCYVDGNHLQHTPCYDRIN